jgi:hypothetical protein
MEEPPDWAGPGVDVEKPSAARIYDYLLGGSHNFAVDREFAHKVLELMPDGRVQAQANRAFLHRAVRYLANAGVRQFLDIGSGMPTAGNVHEIAQRIAPDARVVYVERFFAGFELVEPGLVWAPTWHPDGPVDEHPELSGNYVGVGRKP